MMARLAQEEEEDVGEGDETDMVGVREEEGGRLGGDEESWRAERR